MHNIIVTGGCGFIGSHLVEELARNNFNVFVIDDMRSGNHVVTLPNVRYYFKDVATFDPLKEGIPRPLCIFHLANTPRVRMSFDFPKQTIDNNVCSTTSVCDWARNYDTILYFAASSSTKYKDSRNPYTLSKTFCECILAEYAEQFDIKYTNMYYYNVYGPREANYGEYSTVIRKFKTDYLANKPLTIFGNGLKERDFTHVYDVIRGMMKLMKETQFVHEIHLGKGKPKTIKSIAEEFKTDIVYAFDKPGEAQKTICPAPYIKCEYDVIEYITEWRSRNNVNTI